MIMTPHIVSASYAPVTAKIPIGYEDDTDETGIRVAITPEHESYPEPTTHECYLKNGEKDFFLVDINEPGTYSYKISYVPEGDIENPDLTDFTAMIYTTTNGEKLWTDVVCYREGSVKKDVACAFYYVKNGGIKAEKPEEDKFGFSDEDKDGSKYRGGTKDSDGKKSSTSKDKGTDSVLDVETGQGGGSISTTNPNAASDPGKLKNISTGDMSDIMPYIMLIIAAAAMISLAIMRRRTANTD